MTYTTNVTVESLPRVFGEKSHPTGGGTTARGRAVRVAAAGIFGRRDIFFSMIIFLLVVHQSPGC